jgi:4a-hydroxytetrahydrobiopterin dehydratase
MPSKLSDADRDAALKRLNGWKSAKGGAAIEKAFTFADFSEAFGFMARAALVAEKMDHHPDWSNAWNTVKVSLSTHSAGGVTALDVKLAQAMDKIAGR